MTLKLSPKVFPRLSTGGSESALARFSSTETAGAVALLLAVGGALAWSNLNPASYAATWTARLSIRINSHEFVMSVASLIERGLMTFFFFVVGLEARREFDIGELRQRERMVVPVLAGLGGMAAAVLLYLAFNAGGAGGRGWGTAMSTDTAFSLGALTLVGPRFSASLRAFLLTVVVVDDILGLVVVTVLHPGRLLLGPLSAAVVLFGLVLLASRRHVRHGSVYLGLAIAIWFALQQGGIDPLIIGLLMGLLTYAEPATQTELERATALFRGFREQPTPSLARAAGAGLRSALSPNERMQALFHRLTSLIIVPLFALSQTGLRLDTSFVASAATSPVTDGIVAGFVIGKPVGVLLASRLVTTVSRRRLQPPVGWLAVTGGGSLLGIGFTVSLLFASLTLTGRQLPEAKLGILAAAALSVAASWVIFSLAQRLPESRQVRLLLGYQRPLADLPVPIDPQRDHLRGPLIAAVTLVEYGDYDCPYCGQAEAVVRALLIDDGDLRYVWRHFPLSDIHPDAHLAAMASEAASRQHLFWAMHEQLLQHQGQLNPQDLRDCARRAGADLQIFEADLAEGTGRAHIAVDVEGGLRSGVAGTPTFFVNGRRHRGAYDLATLRAEIALARQRVLLDGHP